MRTRRRSDGGFTLLESLITLVIVSSVLIAGATAMVAMQRSTGSSSVRIRIELALTAYSEAIKAATFVPCATTATYATVLWTPPSPMVSTGAGKAQSISAVANYRGNSTPLAPCVVGPAQDSRQTVTVTISYQGKSVTADIVKRAPAACPDLTCTW